MHFSIPTIVVAGLAAGQAAATGWQLDANKYSSPDNSNNECSTEQKPGYTWDSLEPGSFSSYGSNKFSGFECGNSFGKRDGVTKRSFQDKCITAEIHKEPKIACDGKDKMTIDSYQVSSSWDTDIDAHHEMPDGSVCKQTHRCTKGGNTVQNTQCGGSTGVTFKPKKGDSGKNEQGEACSIGIHSIGFKCGDNTPSSTQPAYTAPTTSSAPAYTTSASEITSDVVSAETTSSEVENSSSYESSSIETTSTEVSPETTSVPTIPAYSTYANVSSTQPVDSTVATPPAYETTSLSSTETSPETTAPAYESSSDFDNTSIATASSYEASSSSTEGSPETTAPAYESSTEVPSSSTESSLETSAPAYEVPSSSSESSPESSAPSYESPPIIPQNSSVPVLSPTTSSDAEVPTQTYEAPDTPDLLPKCINTWIGQSDCKDNADFSCYCCNSDLIKKVMECIEAWSNDDDDKTQSAAGYLQGICAPYVPENPAIITACPSKPTTTPASETAPVPEVPEETAPAYESSSTEGSPVTSAPVEMTTSTVYSTAISTITSCAADVTDCPAASQSTVLVTETIAISTTVCPVSEAQTTQASTENSPESSNNVPTESAPAPTVPAEPTTLTYYSTSAVTITSCAADVTDCPASSTVISSTEIPISYSVVTPEASSPASPEQVTTAPAGSAPVPYASETAPAVTGPAPTTPAPAGPSTIITYSSSIEVPATYSTGESYGQNIPSSSTYITIDTIITVPQVQFVTSTITVPGATGTISVGLAAGSPSEVPAYPTPTADSVGGVPGVAGAASSSGFGTAYVPASTKSPITPYEGAASVARTGFTGAVVGVVAAFFVL